VRPPPRAPSGFRCRPPSAAVCSGVISLLILITRAAYMYDTPCSSSPWNRLLVPGMGHAHVVPGRGVPGRGGRVPGGRAPRAAPRDATAPPQMSGADPLTVTPPEGGPRTTSAMCRTCVHQTDCHLAACTHFG